MPYPSAVSKQLMPRSSARPTARANSGHDGRHRASADGADASRGDVKRARPRRERLAEYCAAEAEALAALLPRRRSGTRPRQGHLVGSVSPREDARMNGRVVFNHLGQCVTDLTRSRDFYEKLLGFEFWREISPPDASAKLLALDEPLGITACYLRRDGLVLELIHYSDPSHRRAPAPRTMDEPGLTHISLSCDVAHVCARVADYGGEVLAETDIEVGIFIRDPDGQLIELLPLAYAEQLDTL
jgi:lactoylglutathione lyase